MIGSVLATAKYDGYLEDFSTALKGQTTFSTPIINYCYGLRERLEILTSFTFTNNYYRSFRKGLKTLTFSAPTNNYCRSLGEGLGTLISSASTNNYCRGLKEGLEI